VIGPGNELRQLEREFYGYGKAVSKAVKPIFKRAAQNIKRDWQENLRESRYWRAIAATVSYEDLSNGMNVDFAVGPELGGAGSLAHISMGYTSRGGGSRIDPIDLIAEESQLIDRHVDQVLLKVMAGR
jgi:hypothetical protein